MNDIEIKEAVKRVKAKAKLNGLSIKWVPAKPLEVPIYSSNTLIDKAIDSHVRPS